MSSKSSTCTVIYCSKCRKIVQKEHTKSGERYKQPWAFKGKVPVCLICIEKEITK